jgi:SAM-dependent methyltransferase
MAPAPVFPFEPRLLRQRKRRARAGFAEAAFLHARAAADLADRLEAIPRPFARALALGGGGLFSTELRRRPELTARIGHVIEADIASGDVVLDPEHLPFAPGAFDLIASPLALHWVNDLPGALIQLRQTLKPDGLLLASLFGGDTLNELRLSLIEAESELTGGAGPRVAPFADLQDIAGLLQRAGFALPAADRDIVTVRYAEPMRLLTDLRGMGETAALTERSPRALSRRILARAFEIYRQRFSDPDGRVRATFEILTATGWSPHESQQQSLKPGSAKTRLADALGVKEQSAGEKAGE